jgi:Fic family protein
MKRRTGTRVRVGEGATAFDAFVPEPLPPEPPLRIGKREQALLDRARDALTRLDAMTAMLPDVSLFLYAYVRKEALLSSQIEGTQSSFADLLLFESDQAPGVPVDDVAEVSDYVAAMQLGLERVRASFPLSVDLFRAVHRVLLRGGRGNDKRPGQLRRGQVWIGGATPAKAVFVPPPPDRVDGCMRELADFLGDTKTPTLIKAALAHVQFETIHPFLDGNGRLGRLLVTLLLCAERALAEPILFLSLAFKSRRATYYDLLQRVRTHGDWESWVVFFLESVIETADEALGTTKRILAMFQEHREQLSTLGRGAASALRIHAHLQRHPVTGVRDAAAALDLTFPTVGKALDAMKRLRIVDEVTGHRRNRIFTYAPYIALLSEGAEPPPRR